MEVWNVYQLDRSRSEPIKSKRINSASTTPSVNLSSLFLYRMSNLPNEPISHGVGGCEGEEGDSDRRRGDSFLLQEATPAGGRSRAREGVRERPLRVARVESVIYFFIIKKEGAAGPRTARLI